MASQLEVFPKRVVQYMPVRPRRTAHMFGRAVVEGGDVYYVKGVDNSAVCATEWIASYLAQVLHLPVPEHGVLQMPDGSLVFGSREVRNTLKALETTQILFSARMPNDVIAPDLLDTYSALFAFDLAIGNPDRHFVNYLLSAEADPSTMQRVAKLHATDFDAADFLAREMPPGPMSSKSHTVGTAAKIRSAKGFRSDIAQSLLTRLEKGREIMFENAMHGLPGSWLPESDRNALMERAISKEFAGRLAQANQGLGDGTYF